jgi:hypothetical protein
VDDAQSYEVALSSGISELTQRIMKGDPFRKVSLDFSTWFLGKESG